MRLQHLKTLIAPRPDLSVVTAITWSHNNAKLAVAKVDGVVHLFDDQGDKKDKFKTKAFDRSSTEIYCIRALAFNPDGSKLAVAQSDNCVFVYRLGEEWGEKKAICNKFHCSMSISSLLWPQQSSDAILYGGLDGAVRMGTLQNNKSVQLCSHEKSVSIHSIHEFANPLQDSILIVFMDGSVQKGSLPDATACRFEDMVWHGCAPLAAGCGRSLLIIGADNKAVFYDMYGTALMNIDFESTGESYRTVAFNSNGDSAVLGGTHKLVIFTFDNKSNCWTRTVEKHIDHFYTVSCLAWKEDGSKIVAGTITGGVEVFDVYLKKSIYKRSFEFIHISQSSVIVKTLSTGSRLILKSLHGFEILKTRIYQNKFIVAHTPKTILVGNLENCLLSEIEWHNGSEISERFYFDNEKACILHCYGEMHVIEFGENTICGIFPMSSVNLYAVSLVMTNDKKLIAFLIDSKTIQVHDLTRQQNLGTIEHGSGIDWLELNAEGTHVLFRDKKRVLFLCPLNSRCKKAAAKQCSRDSLLMTESCQYAQWVPESEALVAQSEQNLIVWYDICDLEVRRVFTDLGDFRILGIERDGIKTEIIIKNKTDRTAIQLDESMIEFRRSLDRCEFSKCVNLLKRMEIDMESVYQWKRIAEACLCEQTISDINLRERAIKAAIDCYEAMGDMARLCYLQELVVYAERMNEGFASDEILLKILLLNQNWKAVEELIRNKENLDDVIDLYQQVEKWEDLIRILDGRKHPRAKTVKEDYFQWLLETHQEVKAGEIKEREQDFSRAVMLYVNGDHPMKAAHVMMNCRAFLDENLTASVLNALNKKGLYETAGDLLKHFQKYDEARDMFEKAKSYQKLIEVCRLYDPGAVADTEEKWGDHLFASGNYEASVERYIQSGNNGKAVEAALLAAKLDKAADLLEHLEGDVYRNEHIQLARRLKERQQWKKAEEHFIKGNCPAEAIQMYQANGDWEAVHRVVQSRIPSLEQTTYYLDLGAELEMKKDFAGAEKAYLCIEGGVHAVVDMYKKQKEYRSLLRFVKEHDSNALNDVYKYIGQAMQEEKKLREAEKYYLCCGDWISVVAMYKAHRLWDDAVRVTQAHGGHSDLNEIAYELALDKNQSVLASYQLSERAIDFALQSACFANAFVIAGQFVPERIPEVHLSQAIHLKEEGSCEEAELHFIKAGKPQAAIDMYIQVQNWERASSLANRFLASYLPEIYSKQADTHSASSDYAAAEELYLKAKRPDLVVHMYQRSGLYQEALRAAEDYMPSMTQEVHRFMAEKLDTCSETVVPSSNDKASVIIQKAQVYEKALQCERAMEILLSLKVDDTEDRDLLRKAWEDALRLASTHVPTRFKDVGFEVASRLIQIENHEAAADLFAKIDNPKGVVQAYCMGGFFDKAQKACGSNATLSNYVKELQQEHLFKAENVEELISYGYIAQALEILAAKNQWERVHKLAVDVSDELRVHYSLMHATEEAETGNIDGALAICVTHGVSQQLEHFSFYRSVAVTVLRTAINNVQSTSVENLFHILHKLLGPFPVDAKSLNNDQRELLPSFAAVRWMHFMHLSIQAQLKELAARQSLALLQCMQLLPPDKAFYLAGSRCKEAGMTDMAFALFNRYLDITDAMEEGDSTFLQHNACVDETEILMETDLPTNHCVDEETREAARDWVLTKSMDTKITHALDVKNCERCRHPTFIGNRSCHHCKAPREMCIICGMAISPQSKYTNSDHPQIVADKECWIQWKRHINLCPSRNQPLLDH